VCFCGDHPADMLAARTAAIPGFGVTNGASTAAELIDSGATYVAASLTELPPWLSTLDADSR
jgi:phosphoglycolate phosphatase